MFLTITPKAHNPESTKSRKPKTQSRIPENIQTYPKNEKFAQILVDVKIAKTKMPKIQILENLKSRKPEIQEIQNPESPLSLKYNAYPENLESQNGFRNENEKFFQILFNFSGFQFRKNNPECYFTITV